MRRLIFVLGMGRSGTSPLTRVLSLCGAALPRRLLPPNYGNPKGYWEPFDALNLNDAFLKNHGSNWYDPRLPQPGESSLGLPEGQAYIDRITKTLEDSAAEPLLVVKEPRITALTDFWFAAARRVGFQVVVVIAVRHPDEVAASLAARDSVPVELSNALWLKYNMLAEHRSREVPRIFVEYPNLLADWQHEVDRVAGGLSIDLRSRRFEEIENFLSPGLRHHRSAVGSEAGLNPAAIEQAYLMLSTASRDGNVQGAEIGRLVATHMASADARTAFGQFVKGFAPPDAQDPVSATRDLVPQT